MKIQTEKLIEFFLTEHEGSTEKGFLKVDYGLKFSYLEIPKIQKRDDQQDYRQEDNEY
jgi:hypothetical protein